MPRWSRLGGQLGVGMALLGMVVVFLGWNGAASYDRVPAQFPYLISGGIAGLALVVFGAALVVVDNQRRDRARLEASLDELRRSVEALATGPLGGASPTVTGEGGAARPVVAGPSSYHRPGCRLLEGRGPLPSLGVEEARERGLAPCRVCRPPGADVGEEAGAPTPLGRRTAGRG